MKALSFLEFHRLRLPEKRKCFYEFFSTKVRTKWGKDFAEIIFLNNWYFNVVCEEFEPEMITDMFLGWKKGEHNSDLYYLSGKSGIFNIEFHDNHYEISYDFTYTLPTPKTLDKFITDCQDAGIELKWRKQ